MKLIYSLFYKQHGLRRVQNLISPRLSIIETLPRDSFLHYFGDHLKPDLDTSKSYIADIGPRVYVDYPEQLTGTKGIPRRRQTVMRSLTRDFHVKNKRFKFLPDHYRTILNPMALVINNYDYLSEVYAYMDVPMTPFNRHWNTLKTVFDTIQIASNNTARQHFIFFDMPEQLPPVSFLRMFESGSNSSAILKVFDTYEKLFILELWKWFTDHRKDSVLGNLDEAALIRTNIVFTAKDGRSVVLNLGYLDSWILGHSNKTDNSTIVQFKPAQLQRLFLKLLIVLQSSLPEEVAIIETTDSPVLDATIRDHEDEEEDRDLEDETVDYRADHTSEDDDHLEEGQFNDVVNKPAVNPVDLDRLSENGAEDDSDIDSQLQAIDEELAILERTTSKDFQARGIRITSDGNIEELETLDDELTEEEVIKIAFTDQSNEDVLIARLDASADVGQISAAEYRKLRAMVENYPNLKDPYGNFDNILDAGTIKPEDLRIDKEKKEMVVSDKVSDKSMTTSTLQSFDSDYINNVLRKDIVAMTAGLQKAGVIIKNHEVEVEHSALGTYEKHTLELRPIDGAASVIHFKLPVVSEDGTFMANGNKYNLRKQRVDLPIRKINPTTVGLTSYYGKTFVAVSPKKANNSTEWLLKKVNAASLEGHAYISKVAAARVYDNNFKAPYIYSALSEQIRLIQAGPYTLLFAHTEREALVGADKVALLETNGSRVCGITDMREPIVVDKDGQFHVYREKTLMPLGNIYNILQLAEQAAPIDFAEARIFSKVVPVGLVLGYFLGIAGTLKLLKAKYEFVKAGTRRALNAHEFALKFRDGTYIFSKKDRISTMILAGFLDYEKEIRMYSFEEFNVKDVYLNLFASKGMGAIYIRELDAINQLFIDPITKGILEDMKEPVTYLGLLVRSVELLQEYSHPVSQDFTAMRIRGYERLSGTVYKEMVLAIRQFRSRNIAGKSKIDISPYQIWNNILKDPAVKIVEDINPIQNLKESEVLTYVGEGGRGKDSMNKASRAYHQNDMGVVSEATVDSGDVGVNMFLTANPNIATMRGIVTPRKESDGLGNLLSTSALMSVGALQDDPKRVNFISIQQSHTVAAEGYRQAYVRTGYEYVIGNRTTEMFCYTAKQDGSVLGVSGTGIIIAYADGTSKGISLGRQFGKAEGTVYPHDVITKLKVGDKFIKGDVIAYNTGFFEEDILDPRRVVMKNSMIVKTVLYESPQTHEDSSSISGETAKKLTSRTTKVKSFVVNFGQNLRNVVKVGDWVEPNDVLMIIEDEITAGAFDEESIKVLRRLANQAPRSGYQGKIDKIEVLYHGEKADMSNTLRVVADKSDKVLADNCKSSGKPVITGAVNDDYRVSGTPLTLDKAEVKIYITIETSAGVGDKGVFASQMKSVIGQVMDYSMTTETGEKIDAVFGFRSIMARIVNSPVLIGTTTTLLKLIGNKATQIYRS